MVGVGGGKEIRCTDYATFGSQELSDSIIEALDGGLRACLLANHGMICHASSLPKTVGLALEMECLARQYITASRNPPLATENLLENTDGVPRPPTPVGRSTPSVFSRSGSTLLPSLYADARYIDDVIVSKASTMGEPVILDDAEMDVILVSACASLVSGQLFPVHLSRF